MDQPLGWAIGNALEVKEAISVLSGNDGGDLLELCLVLGSNIMILAGAAETEAEARGKLETSIKDGTALKKLAEFVEAQGGNAEEVYDCSKLPEAAVKLQVRAQEDGYVTGIKADSVGLVSLHLGGGRATKESDIDLAVGIMLEKKIGDKVSDGDVLAVIHANDDIKAKEAAKMLLDAYSFAPQLQERKPFIRGVVK